MQVYLLGCHFFSLSLVVALILLRRNESWDVGVNFLFMDRLWVVSACSLGFCSFGCDWCTLALVSAYRPLVSSNERVASQCFLLITLSGRGLRQCLVLRL